MWTSENLAQYDRDKLRYPSDVTGAEWEHIASLIRRPSAAGASAAWMCEKWSMA